MSIRFSRLPALPGEMVLKVRHPMGIPGNVTLAHIVHSDVADDGHYANVNTVNFTAGA